MTATEQRLSQLEARMESVATKGDIGEVMAALGKLQTKVDGLEAKVDLILEPLPGARQ